MEVQMNLMQNDTFHWQLPDGFELHSGDRVEIFRTGDWIPGRVEYRPRREYLIELDDGEEVALDEDLTIRVVGRKWVSY